ncbi:MAG: hypothetical protein R6U96_05805 [Promethearchaeia archaeon]
MKRNKKVWISLIFTVTFLIGNGLSMFVFAEEPPTYEYTHQGDSETPVVVDDLKGKTLTWKIINASGVFADEDLQPGTLIRYKVDTIDTENEYYKVKVAKKFWGDTEFSNYSSANATFSTELPYLLYKRDWGQLAGYFVEEDSSFWGDKERIHNSYLAEYETEWWEWKLLNSVTVSFEMNETNYDRIKYTRGEGLLLERKAVVNAADGEVKGYLYIKLDSYSGALILSPWFYIIVISIIIGLIAVVIIVVSLIIQKRKQQYREIERL